MVRWGRDGKIRVLRVVENGLIVFLVALYLFIICLKFSGGSGSSVMFCKRGAPGDIRVCLSRGGVVCGVVGSRGVDEKGNRFVDVVIGGCEARYKIISVGLGFFGSVLCDIQLGGVDGLRGVRFYTGGRQICFDSGGGGTDCGVVGCKSCCSISCCSGGLGGRIFS